MNKLIQEPSQMHGTTILGLIHGGTAALGGDGQVTFDQTIITNNANKIRRLHHNKVLAGFAGAAADAFTLFTKFEEKLEQHSGRLTRAAVELAKEWRMDKYLRRLEAMLAVLDREQAIIISGTGEIIEPEDNIIAVGAGAPYALACARALMQNTDLKACEIIKKSLVITSQICIYTNENITLETLE
jgi:ATP-dependent HslUV protease subunit HslV